MHTKRERPTTKTSTSKPKWEKKKNEYALSELVLRKIWWKLKLQSYEGIDENCIWRTTNYSHMKE